MIGEQLFLFFGTMSSRGLGTDHSGLVRANSVPESPPADLFGRCTNDSATVFDTLISEGFHGRLSV